VRKYDPHSLFLHFSRRPPSARKMAKPQAVSDVQFDKMPKIVEQSGSSVGNNTDLERA
jgi:hypothetical protein